MKRRQLSSRAKRRISTYLETVLYIGVTNDVYTRLKQHKENSIDKKTFAGRYNCYYLIYWERFVDIYHAIEREKELKG